MLAKLFIFYPLVHRLNQVVLNLSYRMCDHVLLDMWSLPYLSALPQMSYLVAYDNGVLRLGIWSFWSIYSFPFDKIILNNPI